jgi:hypothetical protein
MRAGRSERHRLFMCLTIMSSTVIVSMTLRQAPSGTAGSIEMSNVDSRRTRRC